MDARELQVTDTCDFVCPVEDCEHGTHSFTVVKREGANLVLVFHHAPYAGVRAYLDGKDLWVSNSTRLETADIQKNAGAEALEKYEAYEELVSDARAHGLDNVSFDLIMAQNSDARDLATALLKDPRIDMTSQLAYGLLKIADYEPTEKGVAVLARAIAHFQKNGNPLGFLSFLGSSLFGDDS